MMARQLRSLLQSILPLWRRRDRRLLGAATCLLLAGAALGAPPGVGALERVGAIEMEPGEWVPRMIGIDPAGEFAYFGVDGEDEPPKLVKIDLETFERVDEMTLDNLEDGVGSAVIDPTGAFAYFGSFVNPGQVVKVDLETLEVVATLTLDSGDDQLVSAVIDPPGEFAYFGTLDFFDPGRVVKVDLEAFEQVGSITLEDDESYLDLALMDPAGEFAYFATGLVLNSVGPGRIVKVDLDPFERVGQLIPWGDDVGIASAAIDPAGAFAYFGNAPPGAGSGRVVKVGLGALEVVGEITLEGGQFVPLSAVTDPAGEFAYLGTGGFGEEFGWVVQIDLASFERVDAVSLESGESRPQSAVIDPAGEFAYFGVEDVEGLSGRVVKIDLRAPELEFAPASLDFGDVAVGTTSPPQTTTLANTGNKAATGLDITLMGAAFATDTGDCGATLPAGESCAVSVTFTPTTPGPAGGTLTATSLEGAGAELALAGRGVVEQQVFSPVALAADPEAGDLSDGNQVFEPGEQVLVAPTWRNDGELVHHLKGDAVQFDGPPGPDYVVVFNAADYGGVEPGASSSCLTFGLGTCFEMSIGPPGIARPVLHWDAAFDEALTDETVHTWTLHIGNSFTDVPPAGLFYRSIETLLHHGVSGDPALARLQLPLLGCAETEFCPAAATTRAEAAVFLLKGLEGGTFDPPDCASGSERFDDVPAADPFCPWIEELARRQVSAGCGGGNYCPDAELTRAQIAVLLLKTAEGSDYVPPECEGVFDDVPCPSLFADWIEDLFARGITAGCGGGNYCPTQPITRAQMAAFIVRTFGLVLYGP